MLCSARVYSRLSVGGFKVEVSAIAGASCSFRASGRVCTPHYADDGICGPHAGEYDIFKTRG